MKESYERQGFTVVNEGKLKTIEIQRCHADELKDRSFTGVWLFAWTIVCGFLFWGISAADFHPLRVLFAVPFVAGWFVGALALLSMWYGRESIVLEPKRLTIKRELFRDWPPKSILFTELVDIKILSHEGECSLYFVTNGRTYGFPIIRMLEPDTAGSLVRFLKEEIPTFNDTGGAEF